MNVKEILDGMADRAFAYSFLQGVNDLYSSRDYGDTEPDYQTGFNRLLEILTDDKKEALNRMEGIYTERRYYAAEYGFKCGLYGAFCSSSDAPERKTVGSRILLQTIF